MKRTIEREVKLVPGDGFKLPELGRPLPDRAFVSTYHDTADLRLARHGVTFRHRLEGGAGAWQLKLPRGASRLELEEPGPPARPPRAFLELLAAHLRGGADLVRVARLRTRRQGVHADGADVVEDSVAVLEGQRVTSRFRELEVELVDGDEETLRRLERALRDAGAEAREFRPKLYRVLDLAYPVEPVELPADAPALEVLAAALHEQYDALLAHDPGTRLGADLEDLHQMRVATRRARAFLRTVRSIVDPAWSGPLREELGWLGAALGPARDLDVLLERIRADVDAGGHASDARGLVEALEEEHAAARADALAALSDERYLGLLDRLEGAEPQAAEGATATLPQLWWGAFRKARRAFSQPGAEVERRRAARGADRRQAGAVCGRAGPERAREAGRALRRGGEEAAGRPRRPPGRDRRDRTDRDVVGGHTGLRGRGRRARGARAAPPREGAQGLAGRVGRARPPRAPGEAVIRAAGGLVVRDGERGREVLVVHRPRYDDWSFPKGKAEEGEPDEECALREVEEETGLRCELRDELPATEYVDARGRQKRVRYWLMVPAGGELAFEHEVDEAVWLTGDEARARLSYGRDAALLDALDDA